MSSILKDLDDLMWPVSIKFNRDWTSSEWYDFKDWCNIQFGMNGWWLDEKYYMRLKKEEYATIFILRWL